MAITPLGFALLNMSSWTSLIWWWVGCPLWPPELGGGMPGSELVTCPSWPGLVPRGARLMIEHLKQVTGLLRAFLGTFSDFRCHAFAFSIHTVTRVQSILGGSQARG